MGVMPASSLSILYALVQPFEIDETGTMSIGIALGEPGSEDAVGMLRDADGSGIANPQIVDVIVASAQSLGKCARAFLSSWQPFPGFDLLSLSS